MKHFLNSTSPTIHLLNIDFEYLLLLQGYISFIFTMFLLFLDFFSLI